eukprot:UN11555
MFIFGPKVVKLFLGAPLPDLQSFFVKRNSCQFSPDIYKKMVAYVKVKNKIKTSGELSIRVLIRFGNGKTEPRPKPKKNEPKENYILSYSDSRS